jgi:sporulation protein YlmC with PRC-barrel domain
MPAITSQVVDKNNKSIHVDDIVSAKARGERVGEVRDIVMTTEEAKGVEGI